MDNLFQYNIFSHNQNIVQPQKYSPDFSQALKYQVLCSKP